MKVSLDSLSGKTASVVATGGQARLIVPLCRHKIVYDDALLLKGLLILYRKNTGREKWGD